jgi:SAM-dependent methyltransferase
MIRFGQSIARGGEARAASTRIAWVRGFGETLPFRDGAFDAVLCKGAMDHFQSPTDAMREIARVLRPGGCVVIALANYDSLSCRLGRHREVRRAWMPGYVAEPHPYFEPPPDHLARFGYRDVLALAEPPLRLERVLGLSLLWLYPPWIAALARLPRPVAAALLALAFALGRAVPQWADVTIIRARRTS